MEFQSTLSVRRATAADGSAPSPPVISIHALREESDSDEVTRNINDKVFQSTLSVRRATSDAALAFCC